MNDECKPLWDAQYDLFVCSGAALSSPPLVHTDHSDGSQDNSSSINNSNSNSNSNSNNNLMSLESHSPMHFSAAESLGSVSLFSPPDSSSGGGDSHQTPLASRSIYQQHFLLDEDVSPVSNIRASFQDSLSLEQ